MSQFLKHLTEYNKYRKGKILLFFYFSKLFKYCHEKFPPNVG